MQLGDPPATEPSCEELVEVEIERLEQELSPAEWLQVEVRLMPALGCRDYLRRMRQALREFVSARRPGSD